MKRVVVFGGAGFIGSHFVGELWRRGAEAITVADIQTPQRPLPSRTVYRYCDVRQSIPDDLAEGASEVVDLAAIAREPGHPSHAYYSTNVGGAQNITAFCARVGVEVLWFTSSMSVYKCGDDPKLETAMTEPSTPYGRSKLKAENIYRQWLHSSAEHRLMVVRPAVIFGSGEKGNFTRLARALKRGLFVYPGRKDTIKACGYVGDLIDSMFFVGERRERYVLYNYCYPTPYSIEEIIRTIAKVGNLHSPLGSVPLPLMLSLAKVLEWANYLGLKNEYHPDRIRKLVCSTHIVPAELMKRGYQFRTDLESGLRQWLADPPAGEFT